MGASINVRPYAASLPAAQPSFHRATVSASVSASSPIMEASAETLSACLIHPFASSALLSSLQS